MKKIFYIKFLKKVKVLGKANKNQKIKFFYKNQKTNLNKERKIKKLKKG